MLENLNLKRKLAREECDRLLPRLQRRLYDLEKTCWDHKIPSIVVFEGWDAAGKGSAISTLTQRLDPRGFKVYSTQSPRTLEQGSPGSGASGSRSPTVEKWPSSTRAGMAASLPSASKS